MKLIILTGSVRIGRKSPDIAEYLVEAFQRTNESLEINFLDLADYNLPIMQERRGQHPNLPAAAEKLGQELEEADALVVVTPEYNGSYSGVLKNALDYYLDEVSKKPVGVVSVSSGRMGGNLAWRDLTALFLRIGAYVAPARLHVAEVGKVFDENGKMISEHIEKSVTRFTNDFLWFADAILTKKNQ